MQITLPDKRALGYAEYGAPQGKPVFFFHGIPGSRLFRPPFDELTAEMGVRLITVDRPGSGLSSFQPGRSILDWPADLACLAGRLGIAEFVVAGHSGGCPYVCSCAYALPERVQKAVIISGMAPAGAPGVLDGMIATNSMGLKMGARIPWPVWYALMWLFYHEAREHPEKLMKPDEKNPANPDNAVFAKIPGALEICRESAREAFRQGMRGHAWEGSLLVRPWGFRLQEIKTPVHLWHGEADIDTSIRMGRFMAAAIPNCQATFCPGEGHLLLMNHWQEILEQMI